MNLNHVFPVKVLCTIIHVDKDEFLHKNMDSDQGGKLINLAYFFQVLFINSSNNKRKQLIVLTYAPPDGDIILIKHG